MESQIANIYSQSGGDLPFFVGKQSGSGWLRTLGRMAFPILKRLGTVAANTASDVLLNDAPVKDALMSNAGRELNRMTRPVPINTSKKRRRTTRAPLFAKRRR